MGHWILLLAIAKLQTRCLWRAPHRDTATTRWVHRVMNFFQRLCQVGAGCVGPGTPHSPPDPSRGILIDNGTKNVRKGGRPQILLSFSKRLHCPNSFRDAIQVDGQGRRILATMLHRTLLRSNCSAGCVRLNERLCELSKVQRLHVFGCHPTQRFGWMTEVISRAESCGNPDPMELHNAGLTK